MTTASKLLTFAAIVTIAFAGAAAVGAAVGPVDVGSTASGHVMAAAESIPRGLAVAADGYRLAVDSSTVSAGRRSRFGFQILDNDGAPVTRFDLLHDRRLHLIVLSRNLVDYLHLHPVMDNRGHWSVELPARAPGSYRVFADFQPTGAANLTLGTDITVAGAVRSVAVPSPSETASVDGYQVTMSGTPSIGDTELSFSVEHAGQVVHTDPYLGAAGHLIAIRAGDLAYLHVHPHGADDSPVVTFTGEVPTAGTYRLFFDFSHGGTVRTASFTVVVTAHHGGN